MQELKTKLVIGISSRVLFDLRESHEVFEKYGVEEYRKYQVSNENNLLEQGDGFNLVTKLLNINNFSENEKIVEVVLLSRNTADTGLRIFNSIEEYGLDISKAVFCGGESPYRYVKAFDVNLFLSVNKNDVFEAIQRGVPAARIFPTNKKNNKKVDNILRIAFDGDSVIFSDESEKIFHEKGIEAFLDNERSTDNPLKEGPIKPFLVELNKIQSLFDQEACPIRTALVTARSAPSHKRVIKTLRKWNVRIDESHFLGGMAKKEFLSSFMADIFFDDQEENITQASDQVASGHVLYGIKNKRAE